MSKFKSLSQHSPRGWENLSDDLYGELFTPAQEHALFAENNKRERADWGRLLADKRFLQSRDFCVWWHDRAKRLIRVGNQTLTVKQFKEMAARQRRLSGAK